MVRNSPGNRIYTFLLVFVVSFTALAQNSSSAAPGSMGPQVQVEGELQIQYQDFKDRSRLTYSLKKSDGTRVPLQFKKNPPTHFLTGDNVLVSGQMSGGSLILFSGSNVTKTTKTTSGGSGGSSTSSIPVPYTFGPQKVLVILVNFQDSAIQPYSVVDAQNMFFGPANNFFSENSYGQTSLTGTVVGWFTIPDSVTSCNVSQIATDAQNAAVSAGVNLSNYTRYVYAFPQNNSCGFAGSSYVGGNPSQSWINGNSLQIATVTHELGHALGLWHSHSLDCGATATICSNGSIVEYGDLMDVMGASQPAAPHYTAFQKERLGWLNYGNSPSIQSVQASGTYNISPYELGGSGPNALKILKSTDPTTGAKTWYYIEVRQAIGFDAFLTDGTCGNCWNQTITDGVLLHAGTDGSGNSGELLDMTPATPTYYWYFDPTLVVGQSFQDSAAGVTIAPTAVSGTGATVQITMNTSSCTPTNPSISITPSQSQGVTSGSAVSFTATVADNDSSGCSAATFNLADAVPIGWSGAWNSTAVSLSPGKSASATLTVTSPVGTADGPYSVAVSATNASANSDTNSAAATYVITTPGPLAVSVATNQSNYQPGQTVTLTVTALSGTGPLVGASVTATITPPSGKLVTLRGTTGSNGVAVLSYKLSRRAANGTYQVGATASGGAVGAASAMTVASTSFTVQ